jgi:hypothetical protein
VDTVGLRVAQMTPRTPLPPCPDPQGLVEGSRGAVDQAAVSVALQLAGDTGSWVKTVGTADAVLPGARSFDSTLACSRFITASSRQVGTLSVGQTTESVPTSCSAARSVEAAASI